MAGRGEILMRKTLGRFEAMRRPRAPGSSNDDCIEGR